MLASFKVSIKKNWYYDAKSFTDRFQIHDDNANRETGQQSHDQPHQSAHRRHKAQQDGAQHQLLLQQQDGASRPGAQEQAW